MQAKRQKTGPSEFEHRWDPGDSTTHDDRLFDVGRVGKIAEGIQHMYESGQLTDATFTERQRNISDYVAVAFETRPGVLVETIVGFIMYGAGLSLSVPNGQLFMSDVIYYVAANFYARSPKWDTRSAGSRRAIPDEIVAHLYSRFSPYETLQRYELDTVNYNALWSRLIFGDMEGISQKNEIEKLLASSIGFTENLMGGAPVPVTHVACEIEIGPLPLQGVPYFQERGAKWSCKGPPLFSFDDDTVTKIPIFNRQLGKNLPLLQTVLPLRATATHAAVRAWLRECGSVKGIKDDDDATAFKDKLFTLTVNELQTFLGISQIAAKMAHVQLTDQGNMALPITIDKVRRKAEQNFHRGRQKTLPWQAELMILIELYDKSPEYPKLFLALDNDRKDQAIDASLTNVNDDGRDPGPQYPQYQSIISHYKITIADIDDRLKMFPPIVRNILRAERDVTRLFHLRVRPDRRSAIQEMLTIRGYDNKTNYWLSDNLLQFITDWYMHGSLVALGSGEKMRTNINRDIHEGVQKALTSIFNRKVSLEVTNDAGNVLAPLSRVSVYQPRRFRYITSELHIVPFLNAVFKPLHDRRTPLERLDVVDLTFAAILAKLDTVRQEDLSGASLQKLPAGTPDWIKHEYGSEHHLPVYDFFTMFVSSKLMNKLLILCGRSKQNLKDVIEELKRYHAVGLSIRVVAYAEFAKMLLEIHHNNRSPDILRAKELLIRLLRVRVKEWLETHTAEAGPLRGGGFHRVAFLLTLSSKGRLESVDEDEAMMGHINVDKCLDQCMADFVANLFVSSGDALLLINDPLKIAKRICANPLVRRVHNRVDFTIPGTNVTGHFIQRQGAPTIWGFRFYTKVTTSSLDAFAWHRHKSFRSRFQWGGSPYNEYALAVTGDYTDSAIWDKIQDCSIWDSMSLNKDAHIKVMKKIALNALQEPGTGGNVDDGEIAKSFNEDLAPMTIAEIINPMFTAAAESILGVTVAESGIRYMRAAFTDLAIAG